MEYLTMNIVVQTNAEESILIDYCITQEAVEVVVQTEPMETQDNEAQKKETPAYVPLLREAFIKRLQNELLKVQQELTQHKEEVVPLRIHQKLKKRFEALTVTEDETFAQYKAEQKKVEKEQDKLQKAKEKLEIAFSLYSDTLSCRAPATNYALFPLERYLLLKIKVVKAGKFLEIKTTMDFVK